MLIYTGYLESLLHKNHTPVQPGNFSTSALVCPSSTPTTIRRPEHFRDHFITKDLTVAGWRLELIRVQPDTSQQWCSPPASPEGVLHSVIETAVRLVN